MKKELLLILSLLLLSACGSAPEQKESVASKETQALTETKKTVSTPLEQAPNASLAEVSTPAPTGASLYSSKCASCHGKDAKKPALNTSAVIAGWSSEKLEKALKGYQDGSYGGKMKGLMQGQSKPLSDTDIALISAYISTL